MFNSKEELFPEKWTNMWLMLMLLGKEISLQKKKSYKRRRENQEESEVESQTSTE